LNVLNGGKGLKVSINNFFLKLPTRYFRYFPKDYEAANFNFLESVCKQGDAIIDVGAHFGLFSVRASQIVGSKGKVFAFEPAPSTFSILNKTVLINNVENIVVPIKAAMSDNNGQAKFYLSSTVGDVANSLVNYNDNVHMGYEVDLIKCDSFVQKKNIKVNFFKIDAEGAELSVLKGAEWVLREQKPYCILSMHPSSILKFGDSSEKIWNFLQGLNYYILVNNKNTSEAEFCGLKEMFEVHLIPK
jgi:FkbM family methyltransferase